MQNAYFLWSSAGLWQRIQRVPMSNQQPVDEILRWCGTQLHAAPKPGAADEAETTNLHQARSNDAQELHRLWTAVETCAATQAAVGELNPRPAGVHHSAAQLVKKTMRRSLSWYTRPLQTFQRSAAEALQSASTLLTVHDRALAELASRVERQSVEIANMRQNGGPATQSSTAPLAFQPASSARSSKSKLSRGRA